LPKWNNNAPLRLLLNSGAADQFWETRVKEAFSRAAPRRRLVVFTRVVVSDGNTELLLG
jgi:hypothetical protein